MPQLNEKEYEETTKEILDRVTEKLDEYLKAKPANVYLLVSKKSVGNLKVDFRFEKFPFYSINELIEAMHGGPSNLTEEEFQVEKEKIKDAIGEDAGTYEEWVCHAQDFYDRFSFSAFGRGEGNDPFSFPSDIQEDRLIVLSCVADVCWYSLIFENGFKEPITKAPINPKDYLNDLHSLEGRLKTVDSEIKKERSFS